MSLKDPPSQYYDAITSDELFDSFMDVALSAEKEHAFTTTPPETEVYTTETSVATVVGNEAEVMMPLPLLLKKSGESIYETIAEDSRKELGNNSNNQTKPYTNSDSLNNSSGAALGYVVVANKHESDVPNNKTQEKTSNTIITVMASPIKKFPLPDYPGASGDASKGNVKNDLEQRSVTEPQPSVSDLYAVVDKSQKHRKDDTTTSETLELADSSANAIIGKQTQLNGNPEANALYAVVDKSLKNKENDKETSNDATLSSQVSREPNIGSNDDYESIVSVAKCLSHIEMKNDVNLSDYAIVEYETDKKQNIQPANTDYQCISDLKLEKNEENLSPEEVAFGLKRLQTEGQADIYNACLSTIERNARHEHLEKKKSFFNFGRTKSMDKMPDDKKSSLKRQQSNIPSLCTGYLFKQGGTGITPKNWRLRWFELKKDNCLYYYKNEQDSTPAGAVMLSKYSVTRAVEANKRFSFKLAKGSARTYYFAANSEEEMKKWMKNLGEAVSIANSNPTSIPECSLKNVSVPAISISEPDCHGFLWKQGNFHKSWRRRYCVLKYGCLFYYEDMVDQVAIGVFKLNNYAIAENDMGEESKHGFKAVAPARKMRSYYFYAESEIDSRRWIEAMKHSVAARSHQS